MTANLHGCKNCYHQQMPTSTTPGLRERKRLQTRARIESAAVSLVLSHGLEAATVDAISEQADVSPRTFFNYFDSKDSAILGVHPADSEELVGAPAEGDLTVDAVRLVMTATGTSLVSRPTLHEDRLEVVRRHPEVLGGQLTQLTEQAGRLASAIAELMTRSPSFPDLPQAPHAELMLALCCGAVKAAVRDWASERSDRPIESIEERAVTLVNELVKGLA
jgi:AcrR family transcriptional regulator